ncbi:MAG TPA: cation transporter [Gammaproteobacteria bacterium]|nr:MAG: cation transporter [Acidithiobacillus sp.]RTZ62008.1 MAG: cation transporter [Gammaproteobacteria bacterium]HBK75604.1 cation transporter [Gammaproteobacteria bacterium]HHZ72751.1 cation transporter [Gammaproteobacteria bacterium]HIB06345.1 cation transporter [Gammaproteobacteria bacterium]
MWLALSGHFDPLLLSLGLLSAATVSFVSRRMGIIDAEGQPLELMPGLLRYAPWLAKEIVRACIDVAWRIVQPSLPIQPTIIRVPANQRTVTGRVSFANSITLTPGTISLDVLEKQIEVHALTAESAADLESGEMGKRVEHLETG